MGVPEPVYQEIMKYPPEAVDEIRLLALHCGLVRMREHRDRLSVQFAAERPRLPSVLKAIVTALEEMKFHPDTRVEMDDLLLGDSAAMTVGGMRKRVESGQAVFLGGLGREAASVPGGDTGTVRETSPQAGAEIGRARPPRHRPSRNRRARKNRLETFGADLV